MKRMLTLLICTALLTGLCSCGKKEAAGTDVKKSSSVLTLEALQKTGTRENLAGLLRVGEPSELRQILVYLENFYLSLPEEGAETEPVTAYSTTADGYTSLTIAQAKTLITPVVLTTENWREYIEPCRKQIQVNYIDDRGNEIERYEDEPGIGIKEGYHYGFDSIRLMLTHNTTGEKFEFTGDYWPNEIRYEDGKYLVVTLDENEEEKAEEFSVDNYTCTFADAVIYSYDLAPELCYTESWDDGLGGYVYYTAIEAEEAGMEFEEGGLSTFIQYGETNETEDLCIVGYDSIGNYVYENDEAARYAKRNAKEIAVRQAKKLDLETLKGFKTREELASAIGVATTDDMPQTLIYLREFYDHLPSEGDPTEPVTVFGTTEEGYKFITIQEAKTRISPYIITTENWKDYIGPRMEKVYCYSYDDDGNEVLEIEEEPEIGILDGYQYDSWDSVRLVFVANESGEVLEFKGRNWPERVSLENGKYFVSARTGKDVYTNVEFNADNYTCVLAEGVVYTYDLAPELLYVQYYDEDTEEWIVVPAEEYEGEEDPMVFVRYGENVSDVSQVGYGSLGDYVFTNHE